MAKHGPNISVIQRKQRSYAEGNSFYYVTRHYLLLITSEQEKIVTGAWPNLKNGKEFIYPPDYFTENKVLKTINYDSLNKPIDTVDDYILYKDKICEKDDDRSLNISYRYYMEKDTILVLKNDTIFIDPGQNAFLRQLNDKLYVFNINNRILGSADVNNWWRIILLEKNAEGKLVQWECSSKTGELSSMFYNRPSKSDIWIT